MALSTEQQEFLDRVRELWAQGLTQEEIARSMGWSLSMLRYRLTRCDYKFGRAGQLVSLDPVNIEKPQAIA
jgi:orotate phosphoribosyltransferase-like protein